MLDPSSFMTNIGFDDPTSLMGYVAAIFIVVLILFGAAGLYAMRDRSAGRIRDMATSMGVGASSGLIKETEDTPTGWKKALIPEDPSERAQIRFQLAKVGFERPDSVEMFFLVRLALCLAMPVILGVAVLLADWGLLPQVLADKINTMGIMGLARIGMVGAAIGFYGPGMWLKRRIKARQSKVRNAFPNALDLVHIATEAGLGFDAAINRVGEELSSVAPEIAYEFLLLQHEISAGRERDAALFDMAERMGIEEAKSFALVIVQSLQFGTSLTGALKVYAEEMRQTRELRAVEKANKLPVQMSGVMSFLMLPALFLITLTPVIIRYSAMY
ncbi:type II secretion system F family protein [Alphaproteobacteria bacterium KMM 3653]|uniref:Type II secretion system F family protein n=1 Tax=Harenicola maris TaxID=2841044 RepID=A0AAP2CS35_9RHOB|nr:type II secretion system F family protein [Harenicola maris]